MKLDANSVASVYPASNVIASSSIFLGRFWKNSMTQKLPTSTQSAERHFSFGTINGIRLPKVVQLCKRSRNKYIGVAYPK